MRSAVPYVGLGLGFAVGSAGPAGRKAKQEVGREGKLGTHKHKPEPTGQVKPISDFHPLYLRDVILSPQRCTYTKSEDLRTRLSVY